MVEEEEEEEEEEGWVMTRNWWSGGGVVNMCWSGVLYRIMSIVLYHMNCNVCIVL